MAIELESVLPSEIEKRSFEIITEELTASGLKKEARRIRKKHRLSSAVSILVQILIMRRTLYFRKMQLHVQKKQSVMEHPL